MQFRVPAGDPDSILWREAGGSDGAPSFVFLLGWCYRIGSPGVRPTDSEFAQMLARHRDGHPPADEETSGNYLLVVFDAASGRIAVQPDHYGWSGVYFATAEGRVVVSNRSALVASVVEAPLDGYSAFSMLRGTHFPFGRSLFAGVQRVLTGCYLEIDGKRARADLRRAIPLYVPVQKIGWEDATSLMAGTVRSLAARLTAGEQTVFDLTGGMDTRLLAAGIRGVNPPGIGDRFSWSVVGSEDLADVRVAQEVADALAWPLRRLDRILPAEADSAELAGDAVLSDGSLSIEAAFARLRFEAQEGGTFARAGGMGGELIRGWLWSQEFLRLGRTSRVDFAALMNYRIRPSRAFEGSALGAEWPSLAQHDEALLRPYRDIADAGGDRANAYKLDVLAQHKLIYLAYYWLAGVRRVRLPFVSWEFSRAVLSIPWPLRRTRRLLLLVFGALAPDLARIPTSKGEPMVPLDLSSLPLYGKRAMSEVRRAIPFFVARLRRRRARPAAPPPKPPDSWIALVREARHVPSVVDPDFVRDACDLRVPTADRLRAFESLLTLELLFRGLPRLQNKVVFWGADKLL